jgi:integrase/recombinase XerD
MTTGQSGPAGQNVIKLWTAAMAGENQSQNTILRRTGTVRRFDAWLEETEARRDARTATADDITLYLNSDPSWAKATKAGYYNDLRAYWNWLILTEREEVDPTRKVRRPKEPKGVPRPAPTDAVMAALASTRGDDRAFILLGSYEALRRSEIAAVCGEHFIGNLLYVPDPKGGDPAAVAVHPLVAEEARRRPKHGPWFPGAVDGHVCGATVADHIGEAFGNVGAPGITPHWLRHWCATELLRLGASLREVQVHLRHKTLAATQRYTRVLLDDVAERLTALPLPAAA